ncbi:MAG TPA: nickel-responsive transcriptional regulator NikR [Candidatus Sulfotelmatobacter sp.]|nr:nickel-responsive transcriptional regulator NikR [Candidatus Sulfotelmatobacter sp.]
MAELARIGIAIPDDLLGEFDRLIEKRGYATRSEAVRDLVRKELVDEISASANAEVYGTVTLIYDHHARLLLDKLTDIQHQYHDAIMSSVHVHLDHDNCLEVILVRGKSTMVQKLANALIATKGVKHGRFMLTTSGRDLP